jgi:two-component system CheB/CheR fusion protein
VVVTDDFLVVGLGASAGGIVACESFFKHVPPDSGAAYVVILHLSPDHDSRLAEVLQRSAAIPVMQVTERVRVAPNHVYVIPPNRSLSMDDGHLSLAPAATVEDRRAPVDTFFRTLGGTRHSRAVCIVLSGTGADGSMGLKRLKEHGGICLAQDPAEAEFADMPRNAIATGLVDAILSAADMPSRIMAYRNTVDHIHLPGAVSGADDDAPLREIFAQLRVRTGHDFSNYKRGTVLRRIERRMGVHQVQTLPEYAAIVREEPGEADALLKDLLISVTNFFRDREAWASLEQKVLPAIFTARAEDGQAVRVWVAGCATGEEAYSVAMLLQEQAERTAPRLPFQVFASDLDERAIGAAREGVYTLNDAADVSPERLRQFFVDEGNVYRVRKELRENVLFARHNVLKDPPFSHLDLVCCRNLLIYLNRTAQQRAFEIAHFALNPAGFLFLGSSESIDGATSLFTEIDKGAGIFRSRPGSERRAVPLPEPVTQPFSPVRTAIRATPLERQASSTAPVQVHHRMLEDYAPPSLVVNRDYEIVHLTGGAARFLQFAEGAPSVNVVTAIRPELRSELRTALYQAAYLQRGVLAKGLAVSVDGRVLQVDMEVRPARRDLELGQDYFLVLFEESAEPHAQLPAAAVLPISGPDAVSQLENELTAVKAQLRLTLELHETQAEELKAANEEQQAVNEELRSSAEELETSREELQSLNEELNTVNQELRVKIEEQTRASDHIHNLINSTQIATVFVDRSLRVQLFTPKARQIFSLIPADRNRPLYEIHTELTGVTLSHEVEQVLRHLQLIEREVRTSDGRWWTMRLLPYRTADDRIDGVVMTFVDVTDRRNAERLLMLAETRLRWILQSVTEHAIITMDSTGTIEDWNTGAELMFGFSRDEAIGQPSAIIFTEEDRAAGVPAHEMAKARKEGRAPDERWHLRKDGERRYLSGIVSAIGQPHVEAFVKIAQDLTARKRREDLLRQVNEDLETRVRARTSELAKSADRLARELDERRAAERQVRSLLSRLLSVQEEERRRIARDIHDDLGQQMSALHLKLEAFRRAAPGDPAAQRQLLEIQAFTRQLDQNLDLFTWELRPAALHHLGLSAALRDYIEIWSVNYGLPAAFQEGDLPEGRFAPDIETNLFRIAQEALHNVQRHASAKAVQVYIGRSGDELVLTVRDDGVGFDPSSVSAPTGIGLMGMRERAALLGGTLHIQSTRGSGTLVSLTVSVSLVREENE